MDGFDDFKDSATDAFRETLRSVLPYWHSLQNTVTGGARDWAVSLSVASQLPGRTDGPADAYRHLLIAAELTRVMGKRDAGWLLWGHERDNGLFSDKAMDDHNNEIGQLIGLHVRSQNGTTADVIRWANAVMINSFPGGSGADLNWQQVLKSGWQVKGATTTQLPNGNVLKPAVVAQTDPAKWLTSNPVDDETKQRLPSERVNWPGPGWQQKFNYTGARKALEYPEQKVPIRQPPIYSRETDMDDPPRRDLPDASKQPTDAERPEARKRDRGDLSGLSPARPIGTDGFTPGRGDFFVPEHNDTLEPVEPGADHSHLQDLPSNGYTGFASIEELDIHQIAEDVFSSLTLDDWAVIPDENDPFDGRDPFADGVKWVPGLGPPPDTP